MEEIIEKIVVELCDHCGQELLKASDERKEILNTLENKIEADVGNLKELLQSNINIDANLHKRELKMDTDLIEQQAKLDAELNERQTKLDTKSEEMLKIMRRIEESVGANIDAQIAIKQLEERIRAKIAVEDRREKEALNRQTKLEG